MKERLKELIKKQPLLVKMYRIFSFGAIFKSSLKKSVKGTGNKLNFDSAALFVKCKLTIVGNNNEITIADTTMFINVNFIIHGDNHKIFISKGVRFDEGGSLWMEDHHCEIYLGEQGYYRNVHIAVTEPYSKLTVGKECGFAYDVEIRTGDSHSIIDLKTNKRINYAKNITIGDHVWVAPHVSILKGANIASNTVIATRSLVAKSFQQENVILAGMPAAIVKENIGWSKWRIYDKE